MSLQGTGATYLPNGDSALIEDAKLTHYLLDLTHEDGGPKARFFLAHGYRIDHPEVLRADLLAHGRGHPIATIQQTPHGMRYTVRGGFTMPDGRTRLVRTVWQVDTGAVAPRLITAHPDD